MCKSTGLDNGQCNRQPGEGPKLEVLLALTPPLKELVVFSGRRQGQQEEERQADCVEGVARWNPEHKLQEEGVDLEQKEGCNQRKAF